MFLFNPSKLIQRESIKQVKIPTINHENYFITNCLDKITDSVALNILYNKNISSNFKKIIKKSKYWKDDANLILEVINE